MTERKESWIERQIPDAVNKIDGGLMPWIGIAFATVLTLVGLIFV